MSFSRVKIALLLCLIASPVWAQEQETEAVTNLSRDWSMLANSMRHAASSITAIIQERNALAAQVKTLEARVKELEGKK